MQLQLDNQGVVYEQIARALKRDILAGRIASGSRLPSSRSLALALQVSRESIIRAYRLLCAEQLLIAKAGSATRVAEVNAQAFKHLSVLKLPPSRYSARMRKLGEFPDGAGPEYRYNLQYGLPLSNSKLSRSWPRKIAAAALRVDPRYPAPGGYMPLRQALADYLGRRRGLACDAANILIVRGTQQAVTLVARTLLDEGDRVVIEDPHYHLAASALKAHGASLVTVRTDAEGLVVRDLPTLPARLAYVSPAHQFPSGTIMSLPRRMELLEWATASGCWILEDDYDAEFHGSDGLIPALHALDRNNRVIYAGSFSKTLFPSLRLGYIVCPPALRSDLVTAKLLDDLGAPVCEQVTLATYIRTGQYEKHLRESRKEVQVRRRTIVDALNRLLGARIEIGPCEAGMHFVVWLNGLKFEELSMLVDKAAAAGLGLHPVHPYYRKKPDRPGLLIGYAGLSSGELRTAARLFAQCLLGSR